MLQADLNKQLEECAFANNETETDARQNYTDESLEAFGNLSENLEIKQIVGPGIAQRPNKKPKRKKTKTARRQQPEF